MGHPSWGNRWAQTVVAGTGFGSSHAYDSASNRVTDTGFGYDGSGNLASNGPGTSYSYSMENLMLAFGASVTYTYDSQGRRARKTVSGTATDYFYSGSEVIAEKQGSSWTDYIFFGGQRIAVQTGSTLSTTTFLHGDHLGSVRVTTNSSGNPVGTCDYEPFGEAQSDCSALGTTYRFTGKQLDTETGLYHFWFRQYDVGQGRWMGVDALAGASGTPQSLNRYPYVGNDVMNSVDPLGLQEITVYGGPVPQAPTLTSGINGQGALDPIVRSLLGVGLFGAGGGHPILHPKDGPGEPQTLSVGANNVRNVVFERLIGDGRCLSLLGDKGADVLTTVATVPIDAAPSGSSTLGGTTRFVTPSVTDPNPFVPMSAQITVNSNGFGLVPGLGQIALYNSQGKLVNTRINSGSPRALAFVLLHEFGHATGALAPDLNYPANENFNNSQIAANCQQTIQSFSNAPTKP